MLNPTHNGVLLADELRNATTEERDAYAARVRAGNRAFVDACFALEDEALRLGVDLDASVMPTDSPTPEQRGGALGTKLGADLEVGDLLFFLSSPHRITHFDDYSDNPWGFEGWRIARSGGPRWAGDEGWGMTIEPGHRYWVA